MKNISFFDQMKSFWRTECIKNTDQEVKVTEEEISIENFKQNPSSKLNYQLIDIDKVFAN